MRILGARFWAKWWTVITNNDNYCFVFETISILYKSRVYFALNDLFALLLSNSLGKKSKELFTLFKSAGLSLYNLEPAIYHHKGVWKVYNVWNHPLFFRVNVPIFLSILRFLFVMIWQIILEFILLFTFTLPIFGNSNCP